MDKPTLVVGAGPVGLTAALALVRSGVAVRIIDCNSGPTPLSKALVIWRRTLAGLEPYIPSTTLTQRGQIVRGALFCDQGEKQTSLDFQNRDHSLPVGVLLPQSQIEQILISELERYGVHVERETRLTAFTSGDQGVDWTLQAQNREEHGQSPFLIGCDGAHSTVRHQLGLAFTGESVARRMLLGDVDREYLPGINPHEPAQDCEADVADGWVYLNSSAKGFLALFPIEPGRYRIIADAGEVAHDYPRQDPTLGDLQQAIKERTRLQWKLTAAHWLADFRVNERQVSQYVHQRILLAGDAAHIHSPAGGQGMNTGMQDALNLAWKIAMVLHGHAAPALLATYQEERHPVAAHVLKMSGAMLRAAMITHAGVRRLRGMALTLALGFPALRDRAVAALSEDDIHYEGSSLCGKASGHARPGHAFPDVPIEIDGKPCSSLGLIDVRAKVFATIILMPGAKPITAPGTTIRQLNRDFTDPEQKLAQALRLPETHGVLIRPDGVIAAAGSPESLTQWQISLHTPPLPGAL